MMFDNLNPEDLAYMTAFGVFIALLLVCLFVTRNDYEGP